MNSYNPPSLGAGHFNCPHCGALTQQNWYTLRAQNEKLEDIYIPNLWIAYCHSISCKKYSLWIKDKMVYPLSSNAPLPLEDMPENVKDDYLEARNIVEMSPRSAAALLRLALQKLMVHLGKEGKNINHDIGELVKEGKLPSSLQQALDTIRIMGNEAVHPGELDLKDDKEKVYSLFRLLNIIVQQMITNPKQIAELYDILPASKKEGIEDRDRGTNKT